MTVTSVPATGFLVSMPVIFEDEAISSGLRCLRKYRAVQRSDRRSDDEVWAKVGPR